MKKFLSFSFIGGLLFLMIVHEEKKSVTYVLEKKTSQEALSEFSFLEEKDIQSVAKRPSFEKNEVVSKKSTRDRIKELGKNYLKDLLNPFALEKRKEAFQKLSEDSYLEDTAIESLVDLKKTFEKLGDSQAAIRVLTLDYLKDRAKEGKPEKLEATLLALLSRKEERSLFPGGDEDAIELLVAWVESYGKDEIFLDPEILFTRFHYEDNFREIFARSIAYLYPKMVWDKSKSERFLFYMTKGVGV